LGLETKGFCGMGRQARPALRRSCVALLLVALPAGTAAAASALLGSGSAGASGTTLYVAPSGSDTANTCATAATPCKTLGHALLTAASGDTIQLEEGTYAESANPTGAANTVPASLAGLTIEGVASKPKTAIVTAAGEGFGLVVNASTVTVRYVTIQKADRSGLLVAPPTSATKPADVSNEHIVSNRVVTNDQCGVTAQVRAHTSTTCKTSTFVPDYGEGLHIMSVTSSTISTNVVADNVGGILVTDEMGPTHDDTFSDNDASTNHEDCGITVASHNTSAVHTTGPTTGKTDPTAGGDYTLTITGNLANDDGAAGILDAGAAPGTAAYHNTIKDNTAEGNGLAGFTLHSHAPLQDMNTNVVETNTFADDSLSGLTGSPGDAEGPPASATTGQSVGIQILGAITPVTGTTIEHNKVSTVFYGIWLSPHELAGTTIATNSITVSPGGTAVYAEPTGDAGYWLAGADGGVFSFGNLGYHGSVPGDGVHISNAVGIAATPDGDGYWVATKTGAVHAFGDAHSFGTLPAMHISVSNIVGITATPAGGGYYLVGSDGGVFTFGAAVYHGSVPGLHVAVSDIVGMAATPTGKGYWLAGSDGGVFSFGASFHGSVPGLHTSVSNVIGMAAAPTGKGYWLAGSDGGIFSFGVPYHGSVPGLHVSVSDIVGVVATPTAGGYWLVGRDGGVFSFGSATYHGSVPGLHISVSDIVGLAANA
jgi:hypothetical protein